MARSANGVPLAILQDLAGYWAADYDWRRCEAKLNLLPQFVTEIDGLDIHFRRLGQRHRERHGSAGAPGVARHSCQLPCHGSARRGQGTADRRPTAIRSVRGREARLRAADHLVCEAARLRHYDRHAPADAVRTGGLAVGLAAGCWTTATAGASQRHRSPQPCSATSHGHPAGDLSRDDILDNITLYWLTNTAVSSARLYGETSSASTTPPTSTDSLQPAAKRTKEDKVLHQGTDRVAGRFSPGTSGGRSLRLGSKDHPVLCGCTAPTRGAALAQLGGSVRGLPPRIIHVP